MNFAGDKGPILPLILAASGMLPGLKGEDVQVAKEMLRRIDPALLDVVKPPGADSVVHSS